MRKEIEKWEKKRWWREKLRNKEGERDEEMEKEMRKMEKLRNKEGERDEEMEKEMRKEEGPESFCRC